MSELKNLKVLYVEDDEATREALSKYLGRRVGKVFVASDGEEGVRKFLECRPNLLIVDLIMPGMSGLDMIGEIRKQDRECRILITSTVNEINTVLEAVDLGIDHYIVKPIDTEDLEKKLGGMAQELLLREAKSHPCCFTNLDNTRLAEDMIRREFLKIMKTFSGKGPQDVKVLLFENQAEITALDTATVMEKTIATNRRNLSMIEQFRRIFYEEISGQLEECVEVSTGFQVRVSSIFVDALKRLDKIILTIV